MMKRLVCIAAVGMLLAACGGDDEEEKPAGQAGTTNKQSAVTATQQTITAVSALTGTTSATSGTTAANKLGAAAQATQNAVQPAAGGQSQSQSLDALALIGDLLKPQANPAGYTGTCECTDTGCTFTACSGGGLTIDGTYSWGGGKLKATGLKYTYGGGAVGAGALATVTWTLDCDMTISTTSIDGTFSTKGSSKVQANGSEVGSSWENTITFKQVTFAAGGTSPTGGSESVKGTYTVTAGGQTQTYNGNFDVTFPQ